MGSEISVIWALILTQLVFFSLGCGDASKGANIAAKFPGAVPAILPGAEIISQEAFNSYLQSGRLAPFKANIPLVSKSGLGLREGTGQEFLAATSLGDDILLVSDYEATHRGSRLRKSFTDPESVVEVQDVNGELKKFQVLDNSYRIVSLAKTIRRQQSQEAVQDESLSSSQKSSQKYLAQKSSPKTLVKRRLASLTESSLPLIRCSSSELGHGISLDDGMATGGVKPPYRVFTDGLISNFDWPLKNSASCIKDQGIRGTCTAFSVIGAMEALITQKYDLIANLSEQAFYFRGKGFLDPYSPGLDGFAAQLYLEAFEKNGSLRVTYEKGWDYNLSPGRKSGSDFENSCGSDYTEFCSNSAGQGHLYCTRPSTDPIQCGYLSQIVSTAVGARVVKFNSFLDPANASGSLQKAIDYLKQGVPVIVETTLTKVFYAPYHGYVSEPSSNDRTVGGHSTLAVGYVSEAELQDSLPARAVAGNGGFFIVKNSWGPTMGDAGYFYISFKYLEKYAYSLFAIQDVHLLK